jgi:DNA helicase-4
LTLFSYLIIALITISIIGIYLISSTVLRNRRTKKLVTVLLPDIEQAVIDFDELSSYNYYFSYTQERNYLESYLKLKLAIPFKYKSLNLNPDVLKLVNRFVDIVKNLSEYRKNYNDAFVKLESEKYADFFSNLTEYPLSSDQIEAVLRDEDNNLVVAGAGTGKTTTISAKVAYILNKKLALPEELLIIAFTKSAVNEMFKRTADFCVDVLGNAQLDVRTFNSFGYMVKRHAVQSHFHLAFDGSDEETKTFLQSTFDELFLNNLTFQKKAINFIAFFSRPEKNEFDFSTKDEYKKHEEGFKNYTLNGIKVKSKQEMDIGNFLYLHGVNYQYEHPFPLLPEDIDFDRGQYLPDFYLPDYKIWHEHYALDENGEVPKDFSYKPPFKTAKEYYHSLIQWKDTIHLKYGTKLIKTYSHESKNNKLLSNLKTQLENLGVNFRKLEPDEILEVIRTSEDYKDFMNLIYTFLNLMKSNNKLPDDFRKTFGDKRLSVFLDVFKPLYEKYQKRLLLDRAIDYNDMVNEATKHINNGDFKRPYKYILIDEFQDMSLGRYQLVQSLKRANPTAKLYGVGDDWQSIFRFTGSDISIITLFDKHFGYTHESHILQTYRFNEEILKVTSEFIQKNPSQIKKQLTAGFKAEIPSFSLIGLNFPNNYLNDQRVIKQNKIDGLLREIENLKKGKTVFLIGRYHHNRPIHFDRLCKDYPELSLRYFTAHTAKGLTCDYAIILDIDSGKLGFPSEIADDPILNHLLYEGDSFENAEERRLFYVAISRARYKNYLLYDSGNPSKFILEMIADGVQNSMAAGAEPPTANC